MQQARDEQERRKAAASKNAGATVDKTNTGAVELLQYPTCDAYIPADSGCNCER